MTRNGRQPSREISPRSLDMHRELDATNSQENEADPFLALDEAIFQADTLVATKHRPYLSCVWIPHPQRWCDNKT